MNHMSDKGSPFYKMKRDNLTLEILYTGNDIDKMEDFYIKEYNTLYPNGYNKETGGISGYAICDDTRNKIRLGNNRSNEYMKEMRSKQIITEETKLKISESLKGRKKSEETKLKMSKPRDDKFKNNCKIAQKKRLEEGYIPFSGENVGTSKLTEDKVIGIIDYLKNDNSTSAFKFLAEKYNVTVNNIRMIYRNKSWKHIPR